MASELAAQGLLEIVEFDEQGEQIFASLISGPAAETLDDGEAATLAIGVMLGQTVVIDERKALRIASERFATMQVIATADIICSDRVVADLGIPQVGDLIFNGLTGARMSVPERHHGWIADILGPRILECRSLPAALRHAAQLSKIAE
ncbi:hypothetical protein [Ensifer aridi]|uniref:hypothetical protein n=1 Tax=Ensifer aridi TaxID=1708715 RepID=UPI001FCD173B|nr:hypothetical protein [Ensifer aridi]